MAAARGYTVVIKNYTENELFLEKSQVHCGHVRMPPEDIQPGQKEQYSGRKTNWTPTGACGSVVYR